MVFKDIHSLVCSVINAKTINGQKFYWENAHSGELFSLVSELSNTQDEERQLIRGILKEEQVKTLLDVACGPATELVGYQEDDLPLEYVGLDRSKFMLGIAKGRFDSIPFVKGDVEQLSFLDNSFEAVLLKHILEHVPSYETTVQEAIRTSQNIVVVDFFHRLLPTSFDLNLFHKRGYWNNWYSRSKFESFLHTLPLSGYDKMFTTGTSGQTAEIYVLRKDIQKRL